MIQQFPKTFRTKLRCQLWLLLAYSPVSYPLLHTSHPFFLEELSTWESLTPCASMPLHREFSLPGCPSASCVLTLHLLKYNSNATFSSSSKVPA